MLSKLQGKLRELLHLIGDSTEAAPKRQQAFREYGGWLSERHLREDAALAYIAAGELQPALTEYKEGNHWQMALALGGEAGVTQHRASRKSNSRASSMGPWSCSSRKSMRNHASLQLDPSERSPRKKSPALSIAAFSAGKI